MIAAADALMGIFGFKRVVIPKPRKTSILTIDQTAKILAYNHALLVGDDAEIERTRGELIEAITGVNRIRGGE